VKLSEGGCVVTDAHQQTSVSGLFAAGDVVESLDQISVAMGQAAQAATAIHNLLRGSGDR
jgi:thioredoxin reductase (NADPH)